MPTDPAAQEEKRHKFRDVEQDLRRLISTLPVGSKLPSERALARSFGCNFLTVRRALAPLVVEGAITRRVGSGTFVAAQLDRSAVYREKQPVRIGVLVLQNADAYTYHVLQAIAVAAKDMDVELSSTWLPDFSSASLSRARALANEGCKAGILPWVPAVHIAPMRNFAERSPIPLSLPTIVSGLEHLCFEHQDVFGSHAVAATNAVVRYFQLSGTRRIAFLGPDTPDDPILQKKLSAYACHASREKMTNLCGLVGKSAQAMDQLAQQWKPFCDDLAVVAYDDEHAVRLITAMHKLGLNSPTHYRIIGFNNTEASRYSDPPLTTVCQNFGYIGQSLVKSAIALAAGRTWQSCETPRTRLLLRTSCGGAAALDDSIRASLPEIDFISDLNSPFTPAPIATPSDVLQPSP